MLDTITVSRVRLDAVVVNHMLGSTLKLFLYEHAQSKHD